MSDEARSYKTLRFDSATSQRIDAPLENPRTSRREIAWTALPSSGGSISIVSRSPSSRRDSTHCRSSPPRQSRMHTTIDTIGRYNPCFNWSLVELSRGNTMYNVQKNVQCTLVSLDTFVRRPSIGVGS